MNSSQERLNRDDDLSPEDQAIIAHRRRVWQARRYCQIKPSILQYNSNGTNTRKADGEPVSLHGEHETADPALAALLRGVLKQLEADLVMISLLDDRTQFFLSGATQDNGDEPQVPLESAQWYGCDEVNHHGGLCERTILLEHQPGVPAYYEVLDMAKTERTQNLPLVSGAVAEFRYYVGMPVTSPEGLNIGTIFAMSKRPSSEGINQAQKQYLYETTKHVMGQLIQSVQALEGKRAEKYNKALSSLLHSRKHQLNHSREPQNNVLRRPAQVTDVYVHAGKLLHQFFDLSGLVFQELSLASRQSLSPSDISEDAIITSNINPGITSIVPLDFHAVTNLLEIFPHGGVLYVDDSGKQPNFAGAESYDTETLDEATNASLNRSFPGARQIIFTPLWDAVHNRNTALCVGWVLSDERIFHPDTDLNAMASFCMATIAIVLRIESQMLEQVKSDFIGSISHETRSPLHNVLGNLDLALDTDCSPQLREMLTDARFGATQLLETIDKILLHSRVQRQSVSTPVSQLLQSSNHGLSSDSGDDQNRALTSQISQGSSENSITTQDISLVDLCEEIVEAVAKRLRLSDTIMHPDVERKAARNEQYGFEHDVQAAKRKAWDDFSTVVFDARSSNNCVVRNVTEFRVIFENLLSNAIRFSTSNYCIRSTLRLDSGYCHLDIIDCGRGFSRGFIKHSLFVPFSQQEPIDSGIGLGLSLVKQNIELLEGNLLFDTDEAFGSMASVTLPLSSLIADIEQREENDHRAQNGTALIPPMLTLEKSELPVLKASIYCPKWLDHHDKRGERSIRLLHESLAATLEAWFQPKITLWKQGQGEGLPHLVFIAHSDLQCFQESSREAFADVKKVVICADTDKNPEQSRSTKISAASQVSDAIITGPILPSKLWETLTGFFPHIIPVSSRDASSQQQFPDSSDTQSQTVNNDSSVDVESNSLQSTTTAGGRRPDQDFFDTFPDRRFKSARGGHPSSLNEKATDITSHTTEKSNSSRLDEAESMLKDHHMDVHTRTSEQQDRHLDQEQSESPTAASSSPDRPRFLLVDDNNVNLKMLTMFLKKCGIDKDRLAQASGGQQAIDMYTEAAAAADGDAGGFDIIFMDLSMPEVSGFDATSAIRRLEDARGGERSHIVALTGLVSDKDRQAAANAGTDEYITKPAGLKVVKEVIDRWKPKLDKGHQASLMLKL